MWHVVCRKCISLTLHSSFQPLECCRAVKATGGGEQRATYPPESFPRPASADTQAPEESLTPHLLKRPSNKLVS